MVIGKIRLTSTTFTTLCARLIIPALVVIGPADDDKDTKSGAEEQEEEDEGHSGLLMILAP
jgi:hypothetical protein